jgi:hypothetical protein
MEFGFNWYFIIIVYSSFFLKFQTFYDYFRLNNFIINFPWFQIMSLILPNVIFIGLSNFVLQYYITKHFVIIMMYLE